MNKFRILEVIGDGTYGVVYKGINIETNEHVAIKKLKDKISSWNECLELNEVRVLRKLNHENIVKLHEIIREQNSDVSLIFEFADVNLYEYIDSFHKNNQYIPEHKIRNIIYQIIAGINYLHQHGIMHRDMKPENILIMKNTNQIKIADFGTAKEIPSFSSNSLTDYVCTRWYRAPECVLKSNEYNESIDVWAIGCVLVELYNLKPLFAGTSEFDQLDKICNILGTPSFNEWPEGFKYIQRLGMKFPNCNKKDLSNIIKNANQDAINLLKSIFVWNWKERPTCAELLNHRYFIENRPSTFSFGNRFERRGREFQNSRSNNNDYNNFNANTYRNERERNDLEMAKNGDNYLRNLNFWNYQNNGGFVSDLNNLFKKDPYINNMGYYIGKDKEKGNSNNNYLGNNNYGTSSTKSLYPMLFSTQNSKNKFSSLAESNIIMNRKFGRNSSFNPSLNQVNDYNNKNIVSKYKPINFYEEPLNNRNNNPYIPNYSKMFHKPTLEQLIPLGTKFNTNLYV